MDDYTIEELVAIEVGQIIAIGILFTISLLTLRDMWWSQAADVVHVWVISMMINSATWFLFHWVVLIDPVLWKVLTLVPNTDHGWGSHLIIVALWMAGSLFLVAPYLEGLARFLQGAVQTATAVRNQKQEKRLVRAQQKGGFRRRTRKHMKKRHFRG